MKRRYWMILIANRHGCLDVHWTEKRFRIHPGPRVAVYQLQNVLNRYCNAFSIAEGRLHAA